MKNIVFFILLFVSILSIVFSESFIVFFENVMNISHDMSKGLTNFLSISIIGIIVKLSVDKILKNEQKNIDNIGKLFMDVDKINSAIDDLSHRHGVVWHRMEGIHFEVMKVSSILNGLNGFRLDKIRWNDEFQSDWKGIEDSFKEFKDRKVYNFSISIKDMISNLAIYLQSLEKNIDCEKLLEKFWEKFKWDVERLNIEAKLYIEPEFIEMFDDSMNKHCTWCANELMKVFNDKVNSQNESIQITMRQFMRRLLNSLYMEYLKFIDKEVND